MSLAQVIASWSVPRGSRWSQPQGTEKPQQKQGGSHGSRGSRSSQGSPVLVNVMAPPDEDMAGVAVDGVREWREGYKVLASMTAPNGWPMLAWERLVQDAARFLRDWGAQAAALGWTTADLFGCDPHAPRQRLDAMGLLLLLEGAVVEVMSAETATILRPSGNRTRFYRRQGSTAVPLWSDAGQ